MSKVTHLAIVLAVEAVRAGYGAYSISARDLVSVLGRAAREKSPGTGGCGSTWLPR